MTRIKMCGLTRPEDIRAANELRPDYAGFVFAKKSRRYIEPEKAGYLRSMMDDRIKAVGVFVDEDISLITALLVQGIIDIPQLHGNEDDEYIARLKVQTGRTVIKAFRIRTESDVEKAQNSIADMVLLDAGAGDGLTFDWSLLKNIKRPYFLAGGLSPENAGVAVRELGPFGLDVSSGIETDGHKDREKMAAFIAAVRKEEKL